MPIATMAARLGGAAASTLRTAAEGRLATGMTQFSIKQESQNVMDIQNMKNIQTLLQSIVKYTGTIYDDMKRNM